MRPELAERGIVHPARAQKEKQVWRVAEEKPIGNHKCSAGNEEVGIEVW